jgi:hypothetical protein
MIEMKKQHKNDLRHKKYMVVHKKCERDDDGNQKCGWDTNQAEIAIQKLCTSN